jgi:ArsR family metal-binding transcriptional regulator
MGNQPSTAADTTPTTVCKSCEEQRSKSKAIKQKANQLTHSSCIDLYKAVENCMEKKKGQINLCQDQWAAFRACHSNKK